MTTQTELVQLVAQALAQTKFRTDAGALLSGEELRETVSESYWGAPGRRLALAARPEVSDDVVERLAAGLYQRLDAYFDASSGRVGHSFRLADDEGGRVTSTSDHAVEVQSTSPSKGLARALIRAAAVVGPEPAALLLDGWANGAPLRFKICLVLAGIYVAQPLGLAAELRVYPLPISSEGLPLSMPDADWNRVLNILGHPVLEIDAHTGPVFFQPPRDEGQYPSLETRTILPGVTVDSFLTALSLVCNRRVSVAWSWNDHGDAAAFSTSRPAGWGGPGPMTLRRLGRGATHGMETNITELTEFHPPSPSLDANLLGRAWDLVEELQRRMEANPRFRIAVRRWEQSATRSASLEDRAVDLRIALESLYLDSSDRELTFRLATTCARHLGTSLEERRGISSTLRGFYGLASRVIHGAEVSQTRNSGVELLRDAGEFCRDGILKIVETKHQPDWADLLLG